jgi:hypothetical protein
MTVRISSQGCAWFRPTEGAIAPRRRGRRVHEGFHCGQPILPCRRQRNADLSRRGAKVVPNTDDEVEPHVLVSTRFAARLHPDDRQSGSESSIETDDDVLSDTYAAFNEPHQPIDPGLDVREVLVIEAETF